MLVEFPSQLCGMSLGKGHGEFWRPKAALLGGVRGGLCSLPHRGREKGHGEPRAPAI